jgi:hypothetical protein
MIIGTFQGNADCRRGGAYPQQLNTPCAMLLRTMLSSAGVSLGPALAGNRALLFCRGKAASRRADRAFFRVMTFPLASVATAHFVCALASTITGEMLGRLQFSVECLI